MDVHFVGAVGQAEVMENEGGERVGEAKIQFYSNAQIENLSHSMLNKFYAFLQPFVMLNLI